VTASEYWLLIVFGFLSLPSFCAGAGMLFAVMIVQSGSCLGGRNLGVFSVGVQLGFVWGTELKYWLD
jgi:hypothetical protein